MGSTKIKSFSDSNPNLDDFWLAPHEAGRDPEIGWKKTPIPASVSLDGLVEHNFFPDRIVLPEPDFVDEGDHEQNFRDIFDESLNTSTTFFSADSNAGMLRYDHGRGRALSTESSRGS